MESQQWLASTTTLETLTGTTERSPLAGPIIREWAEELDRAEYEPRRLRIKGGERLDGATGKPK